MKQSRVACVTYPSLMGTLFREDHVSRARVEIECLAPRIPLHY